jgi:hypothetical protein
LADLLEPTGPQSRPPAAPRAPTGIQGIVAQLAGVPRDPGRAAAPIVDLDEQLTAPFPSMSSGPVPQYGPDIDPDPDLDALPPALAPVVSDPEPWEAAASARGRGGMVWGFVALSVMLAAALGWVLYTQTDIFEGDVVAKRDAQAQAEAEAELARAQQAAQDDAQQLGTIQLSSEPDGATDRPRSSTICRSTAST